MTESMTGSALPPAGWYPDAGGPGFARWWDGGAWTEHVQALGPAHAEPLAQDMSRPVTPVSLGQPGPIGVGMDPVDIVKRLQDAGEPAPVSPVDFVTGQHSTSAFLDDRPSGSGPSGGAGSSGGASSSGGELVLSRRQRRELEAAGTVLVEPATVAPEATVAERLAEAGTAAAAAPRASVVPPSPAPTIPPPGAAAPVVKPAAAEPVVIERAVVEAPVTEPESAAAAPSAPAAPTAEEIAAAIAARPRGARAAARAATAATTSTPAVAPLIAAAVAAQPPVIVTTPSSAFGTSTAQTSLAGDPADAAPQAAFVDYPMSASILQVELSVSVPSAPTVAPEFETISPSAPSSAGTVEPARSPLAGLTGPQRVAPQAARPAAPEHPQVAAPGGAVAAAPAPVSAAVTAGATGFDALLAMAPPPEPGTSAAPVTAGSARVAPPFAQGAETSAPERGRSFAQPASGEPGSADFGPMGRAWPGSVATPPQRTAGASSGAAWMLALSPLVGLVVVVLSLADSIALAVPALAPVLAPIGSGIAGLLALLPAAVAPFAPLALGVIGILLTLLLAVADSRTLATAGHAKRPPVVLALLGPLVYLAVRAIVLRRAPGAAAPAWVNLALSVVVGAATAAAVVLLPSVATGDQLRMVEALITQDLAAQGVTAAVACPDGVLFGLGQSFTCEARDDLGVVGLSTVTVTGPASVEWTTQLAAAPAE